MATESLVRLLQQGIGYHHAGLPSCDRQGVEDAYAIGAVRILCSTSTLALGVNLPAQLVVIKSTRYWAGARGYQEYEPHEIIQMTGRAGRPGFDDVGTAVIMTSRESLDDWQEARHAGLFTPCQLLTWTLLPNTRTRTHTVVHTHAHICAHTRLVVATFVRVIRVALLLLNCPLCLHNVSTQHCSHRNAHRALPHHAVVLCISCPYCIILRDDVHTYATHNPLPYTTAPTPRAKQIIQTGLPAVESRLPSHIVEHLNSEVVLRTITSVAEACTWIKSTFYYVRIVQNPRQYGFGGRAAPTVEEIDSKLERMIVANLRRLEEASFLSWDAQEDQRDSTSSFACTPTGRIMTLHYLRFESAKAITDGSLDAAASVGIKKLLTILSNSDEVAKAMTLRRSEKKPLNNISHATGRYRALKKSRVQTVGEKAFQLFQAALCGVKIEDWALVADTMHCFKEGRRLLRAIIHHLENINSPTIGKWTAKDFLHVSVLLPCMVSILPLHCTVYCRVR